MLESPEFLYGLERYCNIVEVDYPSLLKSRCEIKEKLIGPFIMILPSCMYEQHSNTECFKMWCELVGKIK